MPITVINAKAECDGCGVRMEANIDAASMTRANYSLHSAALDAYRDGMGHSVQGSDQILCGRCTNQVDDFVTADRNATDDEISQALDTTQ